MTPVGQGNEVTTSWIRSSQVVLQR
jgi:hypothetical protein